MTWEASRNSMNRQAIEMTQSRILIVGFIVIGIGVLLTPVTTFAADEVAYIEMARAMVEHQSLFLQYHDVPDGAGIISRTFYVAPPFNGNVTPQYPSGYALIAAPFYLLFGVKGLILMNGLSTIAAGWLTWRVAFSLSGDREISNITTMLTMAVSYVMSYTFSIWPHMSAFAAVLCAIWFAIRSVEAGIARGSSLRFAIFSGLLFGVGFSLRIESLFYLAATFVWLRIFSAPSNRLTAVALLAGFAPAFGLAAWLNKLKFDVWNPMTYGPGAKLADQFDAYIVFGLVGLVLLTAIFVVDVSDKRFAHAIKILQSRIVIFGMAVVILIAAFFVPLVQTTLRGAYVLFFDIQSLSDARMVLEIARDEHGYIDFYGLPKKAFVQSLPFVALAAPAIIGFFQSKNVKPISLCLLIIGIPGLFFSLKSFQGGATYNMRYFLVFIPFISFLCAASLKGLRAKFANADYVMRLSGIAGFFLALIVYQMFAPRIPALQTPLSVYPQLLLFAATLCGLVVYNYSQHIKATYVACALAGLSLGYTMHLSVSDMAGYLNFRVDGSALERKYANLFPSGSLVVSRLEGSLIQASLNGAHVFHAAENERDDLLQTIDAYANDQRCVYVHTEGAAIILGRDKFIDISSPKIDVNYPRDKMYTLPKQIQRCRLSYAES